MKILLFLLLTVSLSAETNFSRLMQCIIQVENHAWRDPGGAGGMKQTTWYDRTSISYAKSRVPWVAMDVYLSHLEWIKRTLETDDPATLAQAWRWGIEGRKRHAHDDYGQRVANLYLERS